MTLPEQQSLAGSFHLKDPGGELEEYSRAELQRLAETQPDFDRELYEQAVELVRAHLGRSESGSGT